MTENINETWIKLEDGSMKLVLSESSEVHIKTIDELIAEAELELAQKYQELLALRSNKNQ